MEVVNLCKGPFAVRWPMHLKAGFLVWLILGDYVGVLICQRQGVRDEHLIPAEEFEKRRNRLYAQKAKKR